MGFAAGLGLLLTAVGVGKQISSAKAVTRTQNKISKLNARQQELAARDRRRAYIRASIVRGAQTRAAAGAVGGENSSSFYGGLSSLGSQLGYGLGLQSQGTGISRQINNLNALASKQGLQGQLGSGLASFGSALFQYGGGFSGLRNNSTN